MTDFKYLYGPVPSRRLGLSLGVDIVPLKTCTYNCTYCQLGRTPVTTAERREYVPVDEMIAEVQAWLNGGGTCDYLTVTGSGEPTLHSGIGTVIRRLKELTRIPVAVITNGSLLSDPQVRHALKRADLVVPSLDAGSAAVFSRINRPVADVNFDRMVEGLVAFSREYMGELFLEVFLIEGVNTDEAALRDLQAIIARISPTRIQINTAVRPPAESDVVKATDASLKRARELFGPSAEIIVPFARDAETGGARPLSEATVLAMLKRRPCSVEDITVSLSTDREQVLALTAELSAKGLIVTEERTGKRFFKIKE